MIDVNGEQLLTLAEAARSLPRCPHIATIYRWISRGVKGVKLEAVRIGGTQYTSKEAMQQFAERLTTLDRVNGQFGDSPSTKRQSAAAEDKLVKIGI